MNIQFESTGEQNTYYITRVYLNIGEDGQDINIDQNCSNRFCSGERVFSTTSSGKIHLIGIIQESSFTDDGKIKIKTDRDMVQENVGYFEPYYVFTNVASGQASHSENGGRSIGNSSHSENIGVSSGYLSHSEGSSYAVGDFSHSEGIDCISSGKYSHSEGVANNSSGKASHAEGWKNIASGNYSHAEGETTQATSWNAHSEGWLTKATAEDAHAEGYRSIASGKYSHAEGYSSISGGRCSHAEGGFGNSSMFLITCTGGSTSCTIKMNPSEYQGEVANHIEDIMLPGLALLGHDTGSTKCVITSAQYQDGVMTIQTDSPYSDTDLTDQPMGIVMSIAKSQAAHSEGGSYALSSGSHAEGILCMTRSSAAHAEGISTYAGGLASHAEGQYSSAMSQSSHVEGEHNYARNKAEHAEGQWNNSIQSDDASIQTIHTIGIGTSESDRKNAHEVKGNGDTYIVGVGGFDGTNAENGSTKSIQEVLSNVKGEISIAKPLEEFTPEADSDLMDSIIESAKTGSHSALVYKSEDGLVIKKYLFSGYDDSSSGGLGNRTASYVYADSYGNMQSYRIDNSIVLGQVSGRRVYVDDFVSGKVLTQSEYEALGTSVNTDNKVYFVTPGLP